MAQSLFGFIGTGNMGSALAQAAVQTLDPQQILLANRTVYKAESLAAELGCRTADADQVADQCKYIFLGVKPQGLRDLAAQIVPTLSRRRSRFILVSMAAGVSISRIRTLFNGDYPVVRICPNTPVAVGQGLIAWCSDGVESEELDELTGSMAGAGLWEEVSENLMDVCGVLGGCTPAFAYMFIEALADGAVRCGMPRKKAIFYATRTLEGSAALLLDSGLHPGELKDAVCSPGGSTIAGVYTLEEHSFRAAVMDAICTAVERSAAMGK